MGNERHGIDLDIADHVATITLDRPPVNTVDGAALRQIRDVFSSLNESREVRAAIFTAAGDRAFIGGVDLESLRGPGEFALDSPLLQLDPGRVAREAMWAITDCAVPVVGAINGPAVGAGVALAACCDILVAAESASFATLEINVGLLGAAAHLALLVGRHKAREMFFLGEKVSAAELHRLGAIRQVVARDKLMDTAAEIAAELAAKSPIALRLAKESMNRVENMPLKDAYRTEQDYTARLRSYEDSAEARRAYLDKREPQWKWR